MSLCNKCGKRKERHKKSCAKCDGPPRPRSPREIIFRDNDKKEAAEYTRLRRLVFSAAPSERYIRLTKGIDIATPGKIGVYCG